MLNSACVTESCELSGKVRALLAGRELRRLSAQVALQPFALADVAHRAVGAGELPVHHRRRHRHLRLRRGAVGKR